jgi:tRNA dimethylallyltransferase
VIAVVGPTASGKSDLAVALARTLDGEILSIDSMQVYRGMDVGTAKPGPAQRDIPHHLIDLVDVSEDFSVVEFQAVGRSVLRDLADRGRTAVIAGGSGLHFRALVDPLTFAPSSPEVRRQLETLPAEELRARLLAEDPAAGSHVDLANPRRLVRALEIIAASGLTPSQRAATPEAQAVRDYRAAIPFVAVGLDPGPALADRVRERFDAMLERGLLDEVRELAPRLGRTAAQAVGYKELLPVVVGEASLEEGRASAIRATLALAKRQRTFFRRDPRIRWLAWQDDASARVDAAQVELQRAGVCIS